jgi:hypothetical protein
MDGLKVPMRGIRMDADLWELFGTTLRNEPDKHLRNRSAMLRAFVRFYVGKGDADLILPPDVKMALGREHDA